jgi:hypothetical protein
VNIGGSVTVDMKAVKARKDAVVGPSPNGIERSPKALRGCTVYVVGWRREPSFRNSRHKLFS